jgi:hypothetical protein
MSKKKLVLSFLKFLVDVFVLSYVDAWKHLEKSLSFLTPLLLVLLIGSVWGWSFACLFVVLAVFFSAILHLSELSEKIEKGKW